MEGSAASIDVRGDASDLRLVATDDRRIVRGTIVFEDGQPALRGTLLRTEVLGANRTSSHAILIHAGSFEFVAPAGAESVELRVNQLFDVEGRLVGFRPWGATHRLADPLHIVVERLETLLGRVVDEAGRGLQGVRVTVWPHPQRSHMPYDVTSDSEGIIRLTGLEKGKHVDLAVQDVPPGFGVPLTINPLVGDAELQIVVPRGGASLRGHVLDESGKPVPGVYVAGVFGRGHGGVRTDEQGAFLLEGLPQDQVGRLTARAPPDQPYGTARLDDVRTGASDVVLRLPSSDVLRGRVEGELSRDAELRFVRRGSGAVDVRVAPDGTFQAAVPGEGAGTLLLVDPTTNRFGLLEDVTPAAANLVLVLRGGHVIAGRLEGQFVPETTYVVAHRGHIRSGARVDQDGTFRMAGLPPGSYTVEAWNGSGQPTRLAAEHPVEAGATNVRLRVEDAK
ncbi:MAG: carboxypeptidase-like regulatory domain-containing protein [Planctomycetota bacterium]